MNENNMLLYIVLLLQDRIGDLDEWSVDNGDILNEEVAELNTLVKRIREKTNLVTVK